MGRDEFNSHSWASTEGRRIEIEPGKPVLQHHCSRCSRDFVEDPASGEWYAVCVSVFNFRKLPDPITKQWLCELCPGTPLQYDVEIRRRLIEKRAK